MCVVYTSRVGYPGSDGLDITVKSAAGIGTLLAPMWAMVGGLKRWPGYEPLTPAQYVERYAALLRARYRADSRPFFDLIHRERVVLLCFCPAGVFCHRHLAVDILEKIAFAAGLPFTRGGELPTSGE
jgi:hypothetical protein